MGCGCKKKQNQASQVKQGVTPPQQATPASVQESIKKVVEKYYKNK